MQKVKTYRSKKYMDFVKSLPCYVEGPLCGGEIAPHHTSTAGTGKKGNDLSCIPLCYEHHINQLHQHGRKTFEGVYAVSIPQMVMVTNWKYIEYLEGKK